MFAPCRPIDKHFLDFTLRRMGRGIFIGDVHGCADELQDLLDLVGPTTSDRLCFLGDLVARGPRSREVLAMVRALGAGAVRGNHEARLLAARQARERGERGPRLGPSHEQLLAELDAADLTQLAALPLWLDFPEHGVRVVHAGVLPGTPITAQEPEHLLHLRSIHPDGTPSARLGGRRWAALYAGPPHVVFGHDALSGLQLERHATGLDTGCVYGGALSALVLPPGAAPPADAGERRALVVSVPARRTYYPLAGR